MSNIKIHKQAGFTLVEIAIVLVIIGLLLGGILKGQQLINSARVRNIADQNASVQAAYYGFIDRYRAVPGDMPPAQAQAAIGDVNLVNAVGGDGNGNLSKGNGSAPEDYGEASALWAHLSAANFIVGSYSGNATNDATYTARINAPVNAFGGRVVLWRTDQYLPANSPTRLALVLGRLAPASVLAELDGKIDDGRPESGVLRGVSNNDGQANGQDSACIGKSSDGDNVAWDVSADSQDCNAVYLY